MKRVRSEKVAEWDFDGVKDWMEESGYGSLKDKFGYVNGIALLLLTEQMLITSYGLEPYIANPLYLNIRALKSKAFPDKVYWKEPIPFVTTFGVKWDYQPHPEIKKLFLESIPIHFDAWKNKDSDKQKHPLFLVLSGMGTGKSRLLQELPQLVKSTDFSQIDLAERFQNHYVFYVSFENDTPLVQIDQNDVQSAIGARMLWQLLRDQWNGFASFRRTFESVHAGDVITLLAKSEGKKEEEMTVFILVDGVHNFPHQDLSKESPFSYALSTISGLVNSSRSFIIGCCAATIHRPVTQFLTATAQFRVYLPVPPVNGNVLFANSFYLNPLHRLIVEDMSGHGRALESIGEALSEVKDLNIDISTIMNSVKDKLNKKYPTWAEIPGVIYPVLKCILGHKKFFSRSDVVPGTVWDVDQICSFGLIRYDAQKSLLSCAYIWVWMLSEKFVDLRPFICDYLVVQDMFKSALPNPFQWEMFNGYLRCLKSSLYNGESVDISQLHAGAILNLPPLEIKVTPLELVQTAKRYETASRLAKEDIIKGQFHNYKAKTGQYFFINGTEAPSGDGWCDLKEESTDKNIREIHQYKLVNGNITNDIINRVRSKAAVEDDIFLLFTIFKSKTKIQRSDLPKNTGLVYLSNFPDYYGSFAARAYYFLQNVLPSVNYSPRKQLMSVAGLGESKIDALIQEREAGGPFKDLEDLINRMKKINAKFTRNDFINKDTEEPKVDFYCF